MKIFSKCFYLKSFLLFANKKIYIHIYVHIREHVQLIDFIKLHVQKSLITTAFSPII